MKPVCIDFASPKLPMFGGAQKPVVWWAVLAVAAGLFLTALGLTWNAATQRSELQAQIAELDQSVQSIDATASQGSGLSADEQDVVNAAVRYLNYPWADLLGALERHVRPDATLVSLELGITRPNAKFVVQAPDVGEALGYVDSLKGEAVLRGITVTKHEETVTDGQRAIRMTLEMPQAVPTARRAPRGEGR